MEIFFSAIKMIISAVYHTFCGFATGIIKAIPALKEFNDLLSIFSTKGVLAYYLGVPMFVVSILLVVLRFCLKENKVSG